MEQFLFFIYLIFFTWLVTKVSFFRNSGLTKVQITLIFLVKIAVGLFYAWLGIYGKTEPVGDSWAYHYHGLFEYNLLLNNPLKFFSSLFISPYEEGYSNFFSVQNSWWNDLKVASFLKFLGILNLFSFGHYYNNLVIFSFLTLFGVIAFYRILKNVFPEPKIAVLISCLALPSFLYWTSGLHKDGLIFLSLAMISYHMYFGLKEKKINIYRGTLIVFFLVVILLLRNFMIIPVLPALLAWAASSLLPYKPIKVFAALYILFIIFFFTAKFVHPSLDFPAATVSRQASFISLGGNSDVFVQNLEPNVVSFIKVLPQALFMSVFRPTLADVNHILSLAAAVEVILYLGLFLLYLFVRKGRTSQHTPFLLFALFLSFSVLLMIGYSVNNLGAINRYRSIVIPFLIVPMAARVDWQHIGKMVFNI